MADEIKDTRENVSDRPDAAIRRGRAEELGVEEGARPKEGRGQVCKY